jgi:hypothetical protein
VAIYCVNKCAEDNGDHEVHDLTPNKCVRLPHPFNRLILGNHSSAASAITEAKKSYRQIVGCVFCCPEHHSL